MPRGDNAAKKGSGQVGFQKTQPKAAVAPQPSDIKPVPFSATNNSNDSIYPDWGSMRRVLLEKRYAQVPSSVGYPPSPPSRGNRPWVLSSRPADDNLNGRAVKNYEIQTRSWDHRAVPKEYNIVGTANPIISVTGNAPAPQEKHTKFSGLRKRVRQASAAAVGLAVTVGTLTACGNNPENSSNGETQQIPVADSSVDYPPNTYGFYIKRDDGKKVFCVWAERGGRSGLSCDWEHYK